MTAPPKTWQGLMVPNQAESAVAPFVDIFLKLDSKMQDELDLKCYGPPLSQLRPVVGPASPNARFCILGRDPGECEVKEGRPFVGQTGQELRPLLAQNGVDPDRDVYWANTVPFKRKHNKSWPKSVQAKFFEPTSALMLSRWSGTEVIALGEHAFKWFALGMDRMKAREWVAHWKQTESRFKPESAYHVEVGGRRLTVYPLPHPSKANATYSKDFEPLLKARLHAAACGAARASSQLRKAPR